MARPRSRNIFPGMRHGHLTVLRDLPPDGASTKNRIECQCDCGKLVYLRVDHLYDTRRFCSRQCPLLSEHRVTDLAGRKFGRWTVVAPMGIEKWSRWECVCECGTKKVQNGAALTSGNTLSCGCLNRDARATGRTPEEELAVRRERSRLSARKNPARVKANKIKYEKKLAQATPAWLTDDDWAAMNAMYEEARRLTRETGISHQVDHIVPINGETVSGLHVPNNLQILTKAANVSKSNRYAEL